MGEYVVREDGVGKIMYSTVEYELPLLEYILMKNYPYIYESLIENRTFRIDDVTPALFKEIVFDNKVVGFSSYDAGCGIMVLKYIYVLPEFRGNNLLLEDLKDTINLFENNGYPYVSIDTPNYFVIKSLIKHGYANEFGENNHLVVSKVPLTFCVKGGDEVTEEEIKWFEKNSGGAVGEIKNIHTTTSLYDKDICACVDLKLKLITPMCDEDMKHIPNLLSKRMVDVDEYWDNLYDEIKGLFIDGGNDVV